MESIIQPSDKQLQTFAQPTSTTGELNNFLLTTNDDQTYEDYIETTTDPGNILLIIAVCMCLALLISVPFAVKVGRKRISEVSAAKQQQQEQESQSQVRRDEISEGRINGPSKPWFKLVHSMVD